MTAPYFIRASSLREALDVLGERGPGLTVLAGGTDVMVQYLRGDIRPLGLFHICAIPELKARAFKQRTGLGALTTHRELVADLEVRRRHPALAEAAATVGGRQTQNVGTIAGNLVNASPAADLLPVMLVSDGTVTLASSSGGREMPVAEFVLGRRRTARRDDELVTAISFAPLPARAGETYLKIGRRHAMEVAIIGLAARLAFDAEGTVVEARLAVASAGPRPFRATQAEARLVGSRLDTDSVREAGDLMVRASQPIDDARATVEYRRHVLPALLARSVATCRERALGVRHAT
jgi:carbon-monoxide dehydrogenase medium subunit